jgi:TatD DNase family protein
MLYDSHAHLDLMPEEELKEALKDAKKARVEKIISCSTSFASNEKNLELTEKNPEVLAGIGLYPLDLIELTDLEIDKAFYFFDAEIKKAMAIGEVGLDFKYSTKPDEQEKQKRVFVRFIELANKHNKPLIIHSRFAQKQVLEMLIEYKAKKVLLHSFVDSQKLMKLAAEHGYFVSVGLSVLTNPEIQKNIATYPIENLLLETDSPIRFNGEKSMPEKIVLVAQKVAELKKLELKKLEEQIEKNFGKLFR